MLEGGFGIGKDGLQAERFGLQLHRETRQLDGYALIAMVGCSRLKPAAPDA